MLKEIENQSVRVETEHFFSNPEYRRRTRIVTQAPMRITLGGGGTDVLWYSRLNGGAWMSAAIDLSVQTTLSQTEEPDLIKINHGIESYMGYDYREIDNPFIRECLDVAGVTSGVEIATQADASAGSGLGGSGALEVSMLLALHTYKGEFVTKARLAEEACRVEIDRLDRPIGPQDQLTAAYGGINYYEIDRRGNVSIESLGLSTDTVRLLEQNLLFFRTGIHRSAASVLVEQKKKVKSGGSKSEELVVALGRIKELGQRAKDYLLSGEVDKFGVTLDEHWTIKKSLSERVSNPQIDNWYEEGIKAGALGGKIMGAGGGGWFVFYVNKDQRVFANKMIDLGLIEKSVRFDWDGAKVLVNQSY